MIAFLIYYVENIKMVSIVLCLISFVVVMRLAFKLSNLETFGNPIELEDFKANQEDNYRKFQNHEDSTVMRNSIFIDTTLTEGRANDSKVNEEFLGIDNRAIRRI